MPYKFKKIKVLPKVLKKVKKHQISKQFLKVLNYLKQGKFKEVDLKLRQPKSAGIWYFRINKQYRGLAKIENDIFHVFEIDDHSHS